MRTLPLVLLLGLPAANLCAQGGANPFVFFPQDPERHGISAASYVRRPDWNAAAEGFQELSAAHFRGIGDASGTCLVRGFYHWAADENIATAETYGIILRSADPLGQIDPLPTGELVRVSGLTTPTAPGGPRGSFIMNDYFATPVVVPCTQSWFMGIAFPANPAWPATDGHSLWSADIASISPALVGENPRANSPRTNWALRPSGQTINNGWSTIAGVRVDGPTLHVGGLDPNNARQGVGLPCTQANIALGGLFPDISGNPRSDGLNLRIQDNVANSGLAFVAGSLAFGPVPIPFPGIVGQYHLDLGTTTVLGFGTLSGGALDFPLFAPSAINPVFVGVTLTFQAMVVDPLTGGSSFSNAQATLL
jgi:hypothetical protein